MTEEKTVEFEDGWDQGGYVQLPNALLFSGLSDGAIRLWAALAYHAREKEECWPGQAGLAKNLGCSEARVRARLKELEEAGLIEVRRPGQGKVNRYRLIRRSRTSKNGGLEPPKPLDEVDKSEVEVVFKETTSCDEVDSVFQHYLSAFPNKRQKRADEGQRKVIRNALKFGTADELKACIDANAASDWHQKRGADANRDGGKHNSLSLILAPKRPGPNYPSGRSQREQIDYWLARAGTTGGLSEQDRERIRSEWVEARNRGLTDDPKPDYTKKSYLNYEKGISR